MLEAANVIWCTGFHQDFSWIDLPIFDDEGAPKHERGVVPTESGISSVGLEFQYAATSDVALGVGRDAEYIARHIAKREAGGWPANASGRSSIKGGRR